MVVCSACPPIPTIKPAIGGGRLVDRSLVKWCSGLGSDAGQQWRPCRPAVPESLADCRPHLHMGSAMRMRLACPTPSIQHCIPDQGGCDKDRPMFWADRTSTNWSAMRMCSASMRMSSGVAMATSDTARSWPKALKAQMRTLRMNLTAAMPLLATRMLQDTRGAQATRCSEVAGNFKALATTAALGEATRFSQGYIWEACDWIFTTQPARQS